MQYVFNRYKTTVLTVLNVVFRRVFVNCKKIISLPINTNKSPDRYSRFTRNFLNYFSIPQKSSREKKQYNIVQEQIHSSLRLETKTLATRLYWISRIIRTYRHIIVHFLHRRSLGPTWISTPRAIIYKVVHSSGYNNYFEKY